MSMVKKVADALREYYDSGLPHSYDGAAMVAINAMREPTEGMVCAATKDSGYAALRHETPDEEIQRTYTAMIDEALSEQNTQ